MRTVLFHSSLLALVALPLSVGCNDGMTVSKFDADYSNFEPGYNQVGDKAYHCEYEDSSVIRTLALGSRAAPATPGSVQPGVHAIVRASLVEQAKQHAIDGLRASGPTLQQIGSCDLKCAEVPVESSRGDYADAASGGTYPSPQNQGGAQQASSTNNQVAGVDEADFIKNDNRYFYIASGDHVNIIDAWPAANAHVVARIPFTSSTPTKLFLGNDRLIVYSAVGGNQSRGECTYGYECVPTGDGSTTRVTVFDITTRSAPRQTREFDLSGSLVAARKVGDAIHSVVYDAPLGEKLASLGSAPNDSGCYDARDDLDAVAASYRARVDAQIEQIEALSIDGPVIHDGGAAVEPEFRASNIPGDAFLSVVSFGLSAPAVRAQTIVSKPGFVYASAQALYVSVPHQSSENAGWYEGLDDIERASEVYKFSIGAAPEATAYQASGIVKGSVLNQFAMDEWAGNLRIATTSGRVPDPSVHSTVTVLAQNGSNLAQVGIVDQIAPSEDIRSVRFDGDRGFLVTFKKTDPLFAIDLANPAAPRVAGELKIPGFSTYMHFMDRTHLLAIGLEADDQGSFAYFNGIQLQIFDVNDLQNPTLLHKEIIGTRGTTSEALTNHLGFNYFAPKNLLALPMTICDGGGNGNDGDDMSFNGLLVYDVTTAGGFAKKGGISHAVAQGVSCNNWWTNANSTVKRSVILDDYVYSVADDVVNVANVDSLGTLTTSIPLQ